MIALARLYRGRSGEGRQDAPDMFDCHAAKTAGTQNEIDGFLPDKDFICALSGCEPMDSALSAIECSGSPCSCGLQSMLL